MLLLAAFLFGLWAIGTATVRWGGARLKAGATMRPFLVGACAALVVGVVLLVA